MLRDSDANSSLSMLAPENSALVAWTQQDLELIDGVFAEFTPSPEQPNTRDVIRSHTRRMELPDALDCFIPALGRFGRSSHPGRRDWLT